MTDLKIRPTGTNKSIFRPTGGNTSLKGILTNPTINSTLLFSEAFANSSLSGRGWYSIVSQDWVVSPAPSGFSGALRCTWSNGQTVPTTGGMRMLFTASDSIYLRYQTSFSSNWIGSSQLFGPHIVYFLSDLDGAFDGPSDSRLNIAADLIYRSGNSARVYFQDNQYMDENNVGVNVSEARATCGGNGQQGYADSWDFFADAGFSHGYYQTRILDSTAFMAAADTAWHQIEVEIILNSIVGGIGQLDGVCRYWWDGSLIWERTNLIMRTGTRPNLKINQFGIAPYMSEGSPITQTMYIADIEVRTRKP